MLALFLLIVMAEGTSIAMTGDQRRQNQAVRTWWLGGGFVGLGFRHLRRGTAQVVLESMATAKVKAITGVRLTGIRNFLLQSSHFPLVPPPVKPSGNPGSTRAL